MDRARVEQYLQWHAEPSTSSTWNVYLDPENTVVDVSALASSADSVISRSSGVVGRVRRSLRRASSPDGTSRANVRRVMDLIHETNPRPVVLVVGGGEVGLGTEELYSDPGIDVIGFDIYGSPNVQFIADAHDIPIADGCMHAVVVQAVLEHVLDPGAVVSEIERVTVEGGIVYAETPFLQHVHEGAYDFTRFSDSGHRWLFRSYECLGSGDVGGPAQQLIWSIAAVARGLTRSAAVGKTVRVLLSWLRFLDRFIPPAERIDGACGTFFLGRKRAGWPGITPREMITYYQGAQG